MRVVTIIPSLAYLRLFLMSINYLLACWRRRSRRQRRRHRPLTRQRRSPGRQQLQRRAHRRRTRRRRVSFRSSLAQFRLPVAARDVVVVAPSTKESNTKNRCWLKEKKLQSGQWIRWIFWLSSFIDSMWAGYVRLQERNGGGRAACRTVCHSQVRDNCRTLSTSWFDSIFCGHLVSVSKRRRRPLRNRSSVKLVRRSIMRTIGDTEVSFSRNTIQSPTSPGTSLHSPIRRSAARNRRSSATNIRPVLATITSSRPSTTRASWQ